MAKQLKVKKKKRSKACDNKPFIIKSNVCREYVANSFSNCTPDMKKTLETQMKAIIKQAKNTNMMDVIDWNNRDLPR
jgi:hypothetical protein